MKTKGYKFGVEWISQNDEPNELHLESISAMISVALLADLFGKTTNDVARDVLRYRTRRDK